MNELLLYITKTAASPTANVEAGSWASFLPGVTSGTSLPVDYELVGWLTSPIKVGEALHVFRVRRNGVNVVGEFTSTPVRAVVALTDNSIYRIEPFRPEYPEQVGVDSSR